MNKAHSVHKGHSHGELCSNGSRNISLKSLVVASRDRIGEAAHGRGGDEAGMSSVRPMEVEAIEYAWYHGSTKTVVPGEMVAEAFENATNTVPSGEMIAEAVENVDFLVAG